MCNKCIEEICKIKCSRYLLYAFWIVGIAAVLVTLSAILYSNLKNFQKQYDILLQNWKNNVIVDLEPVSLSVNCPVGKEDFFNYYWQGTQEGCLCHDKSISQHSCCTSNKDSDCHTCKGDSIYPVSAQNLRVWGYPDSQNKLIYPFKLCAQRLTSYDFSRAPQTKGVCASNEKPCGGTIDQTKMYCVPKSSLCPITKILISNITNVSTEYTESKKISSNIFLHIARDTDDYPLSETKIQEGGGVCSNGEINKSPSRVDYILLDPPRKNCPVDLRFIPFSSQMSEAQLFLINDIFFSLKLRLPKYELSKFYYYQNYYRGYIPLDFHCRPIIKKFFEQANSLSDFNSIVLCALIFSCLFAAYLIFLENFTLCEYQDGLAYGLTCFESQGSCAKWIIIPIKIITFGGLGVCNFWYFKLFNDQKQFFNEIISKQCTDLETTALFGSLDETMNKKMMNTFFAFWFLYLMFEPHMAYLYVKLWEECTGKKHKKEIALHSEASQSHLENLNNDNDHKKHKKDKKDKKKDKHKHQEHYEMTNQDNYVKIDQQNVQIQHNPVFGQPQIQQPMQPVQFVQPPPQQIQNYPAQQQLYPQQQQFNQPNYSNQQGIPQPFVPYQQNAQFGVQYNQYPNQQYNQQYGQGELQH